MRLTYKQSIDGYTDVGLCEGVTIDEAICKLADYEEADVYEQAYTNGYSAGYAAGRRSAGESK